MYDSAEVHTVLKSKKPISFYVAIAGLFLAVAMSWFAGSRLYKKMHPEPLGVVASAAAPDGAVALHPSDVSPAKYPDFKPIVEGVPESAPAYNNLLKVADVPLMVGCIYSKVKDVCKCYTGQATPYVVTREYCMMQIENKRFNPYFNNRSVQQNVNVVQPITVGSVNEPLSKVVNE
jgi:zona occludens toxin